MSLAAQEFSMRFWWWNISKVQKPMSVQHASERRIEKKLAKTIKKLLAWQGHKFRQIDYVNLCCMSRDGDLMLPHLLHVQRPSSSLDHGFKLPLRQCSRWNSSKGHHWQTNFSILTSVIIVGTRHLNSTQRNLLELHHNIYHSVQNGW